jgi:aspartyl-tRNA(Asn)/glutamyl-tRNA(Gln) amidotransferase subunit A
MNEICQCSIRELRRRVVEKEVSACEISRSFLDRIEQVDHHTRAFLAVEADQLLEDATRLDKKIASGQLKAGLLVGVPLAIKDNIVIQGMRTSCASRVLENYVPPYDATAIQRLKAEGAMFLGKTNCDEFAMGSSNENSAYFTTKNPWNLEVVPGGSSGGSAAAVAAREAPGALGSETGGSIRQPAAFCGVVGLKPTYGRVSRFGLVAFASSLDQIGPLAQTVDDTALLLQALAGPDNRDSTCSTRPPDDYLVGINEDVKGCKIGLPKEWFGSGLSSQIEEKLREAIAKLEGLGCEMVEVSLPHTEHAIAVYCIIAFAEASSNLARYDGVRYGRRSSEYEDLATMFRRTRSEGFGEEVKRRIMLGTYVLSSGYYDEYFLKASKVRTLLKNDYLRAFEQVDFLLGPTTPSLPFKIGEKVSDPLQMYLSDIYTVSTNLVGVPGLSMPCGYSEDGLPVGLQIQASHFEEAKLLRLAYALEQELAIQQPDLPFDSN